MHQETFGVRAVASFSCLRAAGSLDRGLYEAEAPERGVLQQCLRKIQADDEPRRSALHHRIRPEHCSDARTRTRLLEHSQNIRKPLRNGSPNSLSPAQTSARTLAL